MLSVMGDFQFAIPDGAKRAVLKRLVIKFTVDGAVEVDEVELAFYDSEKNKIGWGG